MSLLAVKKLSFYYVEDDKKRYILKDINTDFERGKFYAILGKSGSGKTTFLSLLAALENLQEGDILFNGKSIKTMELDAYRSDNVGIVFQSYNLIPYLTAVENVTVAMGITNNKMPNNVESVATNLLDYLGINNEEANRRVTKLSGGEQQRVAIARTLSTNVDLILADEPTGNLDEHTAQEIINIFKNLSHNHNKCIIMVTHSKDLARQADEIVYLSEGGIIKSE